MQFSISPTNQNLAQVTKFQLHFDRLPYMTFFCTSATMPGLSLDPITRSNLFIELFSPGDKLHYDTLDIKFLVDEDYKSWQGVHDWIRGMTFPKEFQEYKNLQTQKRVQSSLKPDEFAQFSDATLTVYTNKNNPHIKIKFVDCFPISLTGITFNTELNADTIIDASSSFKFSYYDIERL
jgi:hypothetical protein